MEAQKRESSVELICTERPGWDPLDAAEHRDSHKDRKELLLRELHNIKTNLFDNSPFSSYIHFYEIYKNLKCIVKYENEVPKGTWFLNPIGKSKTYLLYLAYILFLLLCICLLFRVQTMVRFPWGANTHYHPCEIHFHVFSTFSVLAYCLLNLYIIFLTYKTFLHHVDVMCLIILQMLYNVYIREKNKEIYRNTETLIEGCKKMFSHLDRKFDHMVLLHADEVFNKFTHIFKYISRNSYTKWGEIGTPTKCGELLKEIGHPREKAERGKRARGVPKKSTSDNQAWESNLLRNNGLWSNPHTDKDAALAPTKRAVSVIINNDDLYEELNIPPGGDIPNYHCVEMDRKNIFNIFGNSIYSNIYNISNYMKYNQNYIHSLMIQKCSDKINYIKYIFFFIPYVINLCVNLLINFYILFSVYYYNNAVPLVPPYELAKMHILNLRNYKGIYYILFIFFFNFFFFLYALFLSKLNIIQVFLNQIYKNCKYESIYYCEHVMNEIYENCIFSHIVQIVLNRKGANRVSHEGAKGDALLEKVPNQARWKGLSPDASQDYHVEVHNPSGAPNDVGYTLQKKNPNVHRNKSHDINFRTCQEVDSFFGNKDSHREYDHSECTKYFSMS
ncbi:conserved Plasmodium protein, unknown function [Plasmodium knowlesi strain H]|uniref:Uncharacterized protein n=3 Tax=Plasmodium knowlesi TaxID=5850 RepID=A0A5K1VQH1_PLAKH|nr:conserved Plasmodium protein, unknown function [Plasmodium knowlesi strain H]OTN67302.1 Uncharacterized protein PKNOH_S06408600 [Plasmodium knowlesi]CAA9987361.1 conserved Plasmodium protein, unknown function [Plasmodium knowlesi strain H]SBO23350.1 conserved Plasmodium protein, unknown function [Plasmodium knowlesi strain H]SBO24497.1 conserved Plasmodium protein, unknown function [Plasmodium knowlesi strain H]VVS76835.1 conserved Plasmodium protein, unknown function [Plasmodium knowlesi s|eukprot:XP_002258364.1 hypothetical protein, conserved in Plasmodium species [Plasmodium knowlesi strain H]